MLVLLKFPPLIALLPDTHAAAHHQLLPRAGTALIPGKRIEGLVGLTARQRGGCCPSGWYCVAPSGCCPNGEVCSGAGGSVTIGGGGEDEGGNESPPTTTTRRTTTTHKATTDRPPPTREKLPLKSPSIRVFTSEAATHEPTTPPPPTTTHKTTTTSELTDSDNFTAPTPTPSSSSTPPPAGPGKQNVWKSVDSTEITWMGEWVSVYSTCNVTSKAKRCSGENSLDAIGLCTMKYTFTGHSIAMTFASSNLAYSVLINEKSWSFSGTAGGLDGMASNCTYDVVYQVAVSEAQSISVQVDIWGASTSGDRRSIPAAHVVDERADVGGQWHLDVNGFVVQVADNSSGNDDPTPSPRPASGATLSLRFRFTPAFMMPSLAIMCMSGLAFPFR
ncbi:hypothetical protein C8J57DRAFT_1557872 [Mycena rebaudengoi]|nr:hypothetical protein C8J57DRAFT_1557872 [Mycena rebaudengoi]